MKNYLKIRLSLHRFIAFLLFIILLNPFLSYAVNKDKMRGMRYCEIIISKARLNFSVYNTIGLNDCPEPVWKKITVASVKEKQDHILFISMDHVILLWMD